MIKRGFDFLISLVALVVLLPIILALALAVRLALGAPVLFRQVRPGLNAVPFTMCKFRTMRDVVNSDGSLLPDEKRLTRFGQFLRSTSLDELPELWNVLKGDMSLVGPRPLLVEYLARYSATQARRHEVRPGLTGWAQVNGRNAIGWEEKFALDVWYVNHRTFLLDIRILTLTVWHVLARRGVSPTDRAIMPVFLGSPKDQ
jgi:lipopolysaccharide/colanic/teichoic acid biosynthesis glycosyltransferase